MRIGILWLGLAAVFALAVGASRGGGAGARSPSRLTGVAGSGSPGLEAVRPWGISREAGDPVAGPAATGPDTATLWSLEDITSTLQQAPLFSIGVLDGPECEILGRVRDAAFDREGRLFVLDELARAVKVFDPTGRCLRQIGKEGEGPGEFDAPKRLWVRENDMLAVLDPGNARIERFVVGEETVSRLPSVSLSTTSASFCFIDDRIFLATREPKMIREIESDGVEINAFGSLHDSGQPDMDVIASPGLMVCHRETRSLVVVGWQVPDVHRYQLDGTFVAGATIPGFRAMEVIWDGPVVRGFRPSPEGFDYAVSAHEMQGAGVLIQIGTPTNDPWMFPKVRSYALSVETMTIDEVPRPLPHIFDIRGEFLVAAAHEEFPRLAVFRRRSPGPASD